MKNFHAFVLLSKAFVFKFLIVDVLQTRHKAMLFNYLTAVFAFLYLYINSVRRQFFPFEIFIVNKMRVLLLKCSSDFLVHGHPENGPLLLAVLAYSGKIYPAKPHSHQNK